MCGHREEIPDRAENVMRCGICGGIVDRNGAVFSCRDGSHFTTEWGGWFDLTRPEPPVASLTVGAS